VKRSLNDSGYHLTLRAIPLIYRFERQAWEEASALLREALRRDPHCARSYAFSALCRLTGVAQGWSRDPALDTQLIIDESSRGISCDAHDSLSLALTAHIAAFLRHDFDAALALYKRATRANPSCLFAWGYSALTFAYLGNTDEAAERLARAAELIVHEPLASFMASFECVIAYFRRDWVETANTCRRHLYNHPTLNTVRKLLIGALCFLERIEEAWTEYGVLLECEPDFRWSTYLMAYPFARDADRQALEAALAEAGFLERLQTPRSPDVPSRPAQLTGTNQYLEVRP
jgi:tetratricopeptide (TPR) repeat protein